MKENKHIEKELLFKNNIKDITSISIDSEFKIVNRALLGNFLISGEYKIHEVSLNREKFKYKIPFNHELDSDIDLDSINVEITNFLYDYNKDELMVNIDYDITGDRKDVLIFEDEESLDEFLNKREVEVVDTRIEEIKEKLEKKEETIELKEETKNEILNDITEERKNLKEENNIGSINEEKIHLEIVEDKDNFEEKKDIPIEKEVPEEKEEKKLEIDNENRDMVSSDQIINSINTIEDGFVTYKIYKIKENETLESIVVKNKTTIDELKEYNDLNNLNINDKIIIPYYE